MSFDPYIHFPGTCAEAMQFYASVFGAKLDIMPYTAAPAGEEETAVMEHDEGRIMHACLTLGERMLLASDYPVAAMDAAQVSVSISHGCESRAAAKAVFERLCEGAREVTMPWGDAFWCDGCGLVTDRFGTSWIIGGPSTM